eukprot:gnl/Spiro4/7543_TR3951_c0_g1_i1.p1 gnl/Spiro4/7543_TR3951_c0_g1~~gnl/Spiro4/7543_TR3951_c0_g1_i1.p1  ORF type:complete len:366 (-),score=41.60 gnl/Spiro4/7543_TR3951_c0_g1_i1:121-1218(-)
MQRTSPKAWQKCLGLWLFVLLCVSSLSVFVGWLLHDDELHLVPSVQPSNCSSVEWICSDQGSFGQLYLIKNTLPAFEYALNHGANCVIAEVAFSSDGALMVVNSDDFFVRTGLRVTSTTFEDFSNRDLNHGEYNSPTPVTAISATQFLKYMTSPVPYYSRINSGYHHQHRVDELLVVFVLSNSTPVYPPFTSRAALTKRLVQFFTAGETSDYMAAELRKFGPLRFKSGVNIVFASADSSIIQAVNDVLEPPSLGWSTAMLYMLHHYPALPFSLGLIYSQNDRQPNLSQRHVGFHIHRDGAWSPQAAAAIEQRNVQSLCAAFAMLGGREPTGERPRTHVCHGVVGAASSDPESSNAILRFLNNSCF